MAKRKHKTTPRKRKRPSVQRLETIQSRAQKRQTLLTKYQFEIGVVTFPVYLVFLLFGLVSLGNRLGQAMVLIGVVGGIASILSIINGYQEIRL